MPSILYKLKTSSLQNNNNPMHYFDDGIRNSMVFGNDDIGSSILRPFYEMPNLDLIDEWTIVMESLLKDVSTVNG